MKFRILPGLVLAALAWNTLPAGAADTPTPRAHASRGTTLERVAAVVNDGVVLASELDAQIGEITRRLQAQNVALPPDNVLREQVLERLVLDAETYLDNKLLRNLQVR